MVKMLRVFLDRKCVLGFEKSNVWSGHSTYHHRQPKSSRGRKKSKNDGWDEKNENNQSRCPLKMQKWK